MNSIITISRQYGSGGSEIGRKLASRFGIPYYDDKIIVDMAKELPFSDDRYNKEDNNTANSLIYSIAMGLNTYGKYNLVEAALSMEDQIYMSQCAIIRRVAEEGPCVFIGRCADYILNEKDNLIKIFIWASIENRVKRAKGVYGFSHQKAEENILKYDRRRSEYYQYHSGQQWGKPYNYDLSIKSDLFGIDGTVDILARMIEIKECEVKNYVKEVL